MKNAILLLLVASLLMPACRTPQGQGAGAGAVGGAIIGAAIDSKHRARGALIGAAAGALVGYAIGDVVDKEEKAAAREASRRNRVVVREVTDEDNGERYRVRAAPASTPTQVTTTVSKWDPETQSWVVQSESTQTVDG